MKFLKEELIRMAENNKKGYPFSACVDYNNKLWFAVNEVFLKNDPTAHAEIEVIRFACKSEETEHLKGATIYCSGEPCPMCLTAIAWAGIERIYYINDYNEANSNNEFYNKHSNKVNEFLNLRRIINKI